MIKVATDQLKQLSDQLEGELHYDKLMRVLYATDASVYRDLPLAVALPKSDSDLKLLIQFATKHKSSLILRAAGTSLAGQCVGKGIVVDISKYFNKILEFNEEESWVRVQPGVVRDELNAFLKAKGYFFSPITATANRAMIGGMVGNNSCGTNSIVYGSTRDHVLSLRTILSDGEEVDFQELDEEEFSNKLMLDTIEGSVYRQINDTLSQKAIRDNIEKEFPKKSIHRRNTGYALDLLMQMHPFSKGAENFNFCKLLCGSEGTLAITTEVQLHIDRLPAPGVVVAAVHFDNLHDSLVSTNIAQTFSPTACELMDKIILDCTKENPAQAKNRFFVEGDPAAVLMIEFRGENLVQAKQEASQCIEALKKENLGYAYPIVEAEDCKKLWSLRSAGLGLLANIPGDKKAVACIEDTAVALEDLPQYIEDFSSLMKTFEQESVYYAHAGAGEIHLRPILNLKDPLDVQAFYDISMASAKLVKKYRGSLSGEHGDGRVRAAFIPLMVGPENYEIFRQVKFSWDPNNIFNPGKIVDAAPMNESLRTEISGESLSIPSLLDFQSSGGILRAAEKCNGSGDCRKLPLSGGTMCPSYQATRNERDTTRARANVLRDFLSQSEQANPYNHEEIKEVMDLCLSCKGCTSECPSNVDMAGMKAEFLHQYYKDNRVPFRDKMIANINKINPWLSRFHWVYNPLVNSVGVGNLVKGFLGVNPKRSLPRVHSETVKKWFRKNYDNYCQGKEFQKEVYIFIDEFTNFNDSETGIKSIKLLTELGYKLNYIEHAESGRAAISKGMLNLAKDLANENVRTFISHVSEGKPLLGIEPSGILSFRDEYPRLVDSELVEESKTLAGNCLLIDEFIAEEIGLGNIDSSSFTSEKRQISFHGHCHQKSLSDIKTSVWMLSLPKNYEVDLIPSGCCGMAGSFGYEKEHYDVSLQIGELVLFPAIRKTNSDVIIAATGTSCRHQIKDGVDRIAKHPVEILYDALLKKED